MRLNEPIYGLTLSPIPFKTCGTFPLPPAINEPRTFSSPERAAFGTNMMFCWSDPFMGKGVKDCFAKRGFAAKLAAVYRDGY